MSENPRFWLAWMWVLVALRCIATAADAHTTGWMAINILGAIASPALAYAEFKRGMQERKLRKVVKR